ncbi:MAG: penicillin-binding protein 2 [Bacilli bacterium]|nr:penicillin-binding protein 2 [Bacilli bacterium]
MRNNNIKINRRIRIYKVITILLFVGLIYKSFNVMIINQKKYKKKVKILSYNIIEKDNGPRGRIYDRNYNIIVDNVRINSIYYKKKKYITKEDEIKLSDKVSKNIDLNIKNITDDIKKEYYMIKYKESVDKKITKKEYKKKEERKLTSKQLTKLKKDRITKKELDKMTDEENKSAYLYYLMNKGYNYDEKIIKYNNVTDNEYNYFSFNDNGFYIKENWERTYPYGDVFKSILGTVSTELQGIPKENKHEYLNKGYNLNDRVGLSYIEKEYDKILRGTNNKYKIINSYEKKLIEKAKRGNDIVLSIDINLQKDIEEILKEEVLKAKKEPNTKYYDHSFVVIEDPNTGEILAMAGKKAVLEDGEYKAVDYTPAMLTSPMTPGSVVKAASMLVGYNEGAIKIGEYIKDECIKIKSTPKKCSWRTLGTINDLDALALSSNVYQFKTAMKVANANYYYNMPFVINNDAFKKYRDMYRSFGLGTKTEIDLPIESSGYKSNDETPGLLLDYVMGQFETYTPVQLSQYISTIANNGTRLKVHLLKEIHEPSETDEIGKLKQKIEPVELNKINTKEEYLNRVKEGLHRVTMSSYGLGRNYIESIHDPSGKTGTSQSFIDTDLDGKIDTETISTAFIGYAPSNNPKITFTVTSPDSSFPNENSNFSSLVNLHITKKISNKYYEYYD